MPVTQVEEQKYLVIYFIKVLVVDYGFKLICSILVKFFILFSLFFCTFFYFFYYWVLFIYFFNCMGFLKCFFVSNFCN